MIRPVISQNFCATGEICLCFILCNWTHEMLKQTTVLHICGKSTIYIYALLVLVFGMAVNILGEHLAR